MSRSISRPFGRQAATASSSSAAWPQTESSASAPSYVLRDAPDDTPHDIHPHAAAYVTAQQSQPTPDAPARTRTLRQMTPAERAAWMQIHGPRATYSAPENTASSSSAPSVDVSAPPGHGRPTQSWGSTGAYQATPPASPLPSPQQADVEMTYSTPSAPAQMMTPPPSTPSAASRPVRTSSLQAGPASRALAALTGAGSAPAAGATPELEIVISRAGGQDITLRLYAPASI